MDLPANSVAIEAVPVRLRADESAALLEIAQATGSTLELHVVLDRVVERTAMLTGADRCSLWLLDVTRDLLHPAAIFGIVTAAGNRFSRAPERRNRSAPPLGATWRHPAPFQSACALG